MGRVTSPSTRPPKPIGTQAPQPSAGDVIKGSGVSQHTSDIEVRDIYGRQITAGGTGAGDGQFRLKALINGVPEVQIQMLEQPRFQMFNKALTEEAKVHILTNTGNSWMHMAADDEVQRIDLDATTGYAAIGASPAESGVIRIPNNQWEVARNAAGSADINMIKINASNLVELGAALAGGTLFGVVDAKGDLIVGTTADTVARLAVGANDSILMADSGETTGLKWVAPGTPSTQAFGDAAAEGTTDGFTRTDHKHAMPADPVTAHVAAGDPHTGYRLESADHSHQSTGAQAGTLAEAALALTDITTNNSSTSAHGFLKKLSNTATEFMNGAGNWATPAGTATVTVNIYTASDTWTKPTCTAVLVLVAGAGGGGGGARGAAAGGVRCGGGGGGAGQYTTALFRATDLGNETITIGAAGTGGGGGSSANGSNGTAGGNSSFGSHITAYGGGFGSGGTNTTGGAGGGGGAITATGNNASGSTAGAAVGTDVLDSVGGGLQTHLFKGANGGAGSAAAGQDGTVSYHGGGGGGGAANDGGATAGNGGSSYFSSGGGGAGGGLTSGNAEEAGRTGGGSRQLASGGGGTAGVVDGGAGGNGNPFEGGGGGGSQASGTGGAGGVGGAGGGGGGGGGAGTSVGGAGGNGSSGLIIVVAW